MFADKVERFLKKRDTNIICFHEKLVLSGFEVIVLCLEMFGNGKGILIVYHVVFFGAEDQYRSFDFIQILRAQCVDKGAAAFAYPVPCHGSGTQSRRISHPVVIYRSAFWVAGVIICCAARLSGSPFLPVLGRGKRIPQEFWQGELGKEALAVF